MTTTDTLQVGDVVHDQRGWFFRVRRDGRYDSFSEFDEATGTTPVVDGDGVHWPVELLVRGGEAADDAPGNGLAVRMALFLDVRR